MPTGHELRDIFLAYFEEKGHLRRPGSSLIPSDPTTLFTSAGMQQFVPFWKGDADPPGPRLTTVQKCARAGDLETVGLTPRHLSFFEMLGNFSFGDYFKREAIEFAWEFLVERMRIDPAPFWVTIHPSDDEAATLWMSLTSIPAERIVRVQSNWWGPVGATGPCGPCAEINYDLGPEFGCGKPDCAPECPNADAGGAPCGRFFELWNLVFPQFDRDADGKDNPLARRGIDTGMGLERLALVMQKAPSVFDTDLFAPINRLTQGFLEKAGSYYAEAPNDLGGRKGRRIIADHVRAATFLLADGVIPSNEERGYALRKLIRRAITIGQGMAIREPFLHKYPEVIAEEYASFEDYQNLQARLEFIKSQLLREEELFKSAVQQADQLLRVRAHEIFAKGGKVLPGAIVFEMYDTHGIPVEVTERIAGAYNLDIDEAGFKLEMEHQRERAKGHAAKVFRYASSRSYAVFVGKTDFLGYDTTECIAKVVAVLRPGVVRRGGSIEETTREYGVFRRDVVRTDLDDEQIEHLCKTNANFERAGDPVQEAKAGDEVEVVLDRSPFYGESGGQIGDTGVLQADGVIARVTDTQHPLDGVTVHRAKIESGTVRVGQEVRAVVDADRRRGLMRAHTATHLLHWALRTKLGVHVAQAGSLVDNDRLRFDFSHFHGVTPGELDELTLMISEHIVADHPVTATSLPYREAIAKGAMALFGEKYGDTVRMIAVGEVSKELCGGTHCTASGQIGEFVFTSESGIGSGLRRVEALTGLAAVRYQLARAGRERVVAAQLAAPPEEVPERVAHLQAQLAESERAALAAEAKAATAEARRELTTPYKVGTIDLFRAILPNSHPETLRQVVTDFVQSRRDGPTVVVVSSNSSSGPIFAAAASADATQQGVHLGRLINQVAEITGGRGGGRPELAQAGGKDPSRVDEALGKVPEFLKQQLK